MSAKQEAVAAAKDHHEPELRQRQQQEQLQLIDLYGRVARKLRLSVTDKCNFRCNFCMPVTPEWIPNEEILTFDEITHLVRILSGVFGIDRVRLSGGEPLMRKDIEKLVKSIASIKEVKRIGMTTNGYFLSEKAKLLKEAGLQSVTVSLHSLKPERFSFVVANTTNHNNNLYARVLEGIETARSAGFDSNKIKINCVIVRGYNDDEIEDFASLAYNEGLNVRFIEYMPFDGRKSWGMNKVVSGEEILSKVRKRFDIISLEREKGSTAVNYRFVDGSKGGENVGEFGIITSITRPFCSDCDRLRLTADGKIVPCLFDNHEYDLLPLLRGTKKREEGGAGAQASSDREIANFLRSVVKLKAPGVESIIKTSVGLTHVRPMYRTGG